MSILWVLALVIAAWNQSGGWLVVIFLAWLFLSSKVTTYPPTRTRQRR